MGFIYSDQKVEELWEDLILLLTVMKKGQYLQELQIKESCSFVIGQLDQLMKQEAKMIQLLAFGVNKDALDLLLPWIYFHQMKASF
jgi:tRNA pseudouridine-54 N-methylase